MTAKFLALATASVLLLGAAPARATGSMVSFPVAYAPGTIIVKTGERKLYLVTGSGQALRYPVGVGKAGRQWAGATRIDGKYSHPDWSPPAVIRRDRPGLPAVIPGGSPANPMGAAAMTLAGGQYAIHGTNSPGSIGGFVSYGCIRMYNEDITDLMGRVSVGSPVIVTR
jgi:lipoprotein-anchoring transpeptidase ErfK/SrfK